LVELKDVLFAGNPMYEGLTKEECRIEILKVRQKRERERREREI